MTQEEKELLLKDLCGRLPHSVKISVPELWTSEKKIEVLNEIFKGDDGLYRVNDNGIIVEYVKPYLFPLSGMTAEQLYELRELFGFEIEFLNGFIDLSFRSTLEYLEMIAIIEWFNKNHFDYRGLIPMGLAIDCTNLNIY